MNHPVARIALILPLIWLLGLSPVYGAGKASKRLKKKAAVELPIGEPVAQLGSPEREVSVFRLTAVENPEWSYMVVLTDSDGIHRTYGDEKTVGALLEGLSKDLKGAGQLRCPAAVGWRFESASVRASYCTTSGETDRIERAIDLLETTPSVE